MGVQFLIVTTLNAPLANLTQKDCVFVTMIILGSKGGVPYKRNQTSEDVYKAWCAMGRPNAGLSHFAVATMPDGREITLSMACTQEPNWTNIDGPNDGTWILSAAILVA